jgi:hypothetical protein
MTERRDGVSRRSFVRAGTGLAVARMLGLGGESVSAAEGGAVSRVVLIRDAEVLDGRGQARAGVLESMLSRAVAALFDESSPAAAWRRIVAPSDVVGIKSNVWRHLPTPPALERAIRDGVVGAGVDPRKVAVDDRGVRSDPVFKRASALINVRPMRTHHWSGLGTCLKNMIMFVPRPPEYHDNACAPLGSIWRLPEIAGKVRLNALVMLTPLFHSVGPHGFSKEYVWPYRGLIVGVDPVAVDATGARIIQAQRNAHFGEERPMTPPPHHIVYADTRYGLGVSDPARIEIVRLGMKEGALI